MELANVEKLLTKYFEAHTTVKEEEELRHYFSQEDVVPHLQKYQPMFTYFSTSRQECHINTIPLKTKKSMKNMRWGSVAVVAIVLLSIYFGKISSGDHHVVNDPDMAYHETKKALYMIGEHLNKGAEKISYLNTYEETKNKIFINY